MFALALIVLLFTPLLLPAEPVVLRLVACAVVWSLAAKAWDCWSTAEHRKREASGEPLGRAKCIRFFANPLVMTMEADRRLPPGRKRSGDLVRLAASAVVFSLGAAVLRWLIVSRFGSTSFLLDHTVKFAVLWVMIESGCHVACALGRLAGLDVGPIVDWAVLSTSPADFWQRYNRMVGGWLHKHVFLASGGRRRYVWAMAMTFFWSAVGHEALFAIMSERVTGYAFTFFVLQAAAVAVTVWLRRRLRRPGPALRLLGRAATILFVFASSIFFLAAFSQIAPGFYSAEAWLP